MWIRVIVGVLVVAGLYFSRLWLLPVNYLGYCHERHGWVSHDELVRAAVVSMFAGYPQDAIPYESVDEFLRLNPDCCHLTHVGREYYTAPLNYRVFGWTRGFMHVKYFVRRRDAAGNITQEQLETSPAMTNCGAPWSGV
jgi:hypothetical protein